MQHFQEKKLNNFQEKKIFQTTDWTKKLISIQISKKISKKFQKISKNFKKFQKILRKF